MTFSTFLDHFQNNHHPIDPYDVFLPKILKFMIHNYVNLIIRSTVNKMIERTYFNENKTPGMINWIWLVSAPGNTVTSSVNNAKQPCLVLTDFSCICLDKDFIIIGNCASNIFNGLNLLTKNKILKKLGKKLHIQTSFVFWKKLHFKVLFFGKDLPTQVSGLRAAPYLCYL